MTDNKISKFAEIIGSSGNIVFFGGAGVSTASGIPDFRSSNGLFNKKLNRTFTPEQLVSHSFFENYTEDFFEFYRSNLIYKDAKPNSCHEFLAYLEKIGKLKAVVTQNIDGLHQMAGSKTVYELHGSIHRNYCTKCHSFYDLDYILSTDNVPLCKKCSGVVKPDVVLYEEMLNNQIIEDSVKAISKADTLIIGGTSMVVYPAAGLVNYFAGKDIVLINKSSTSADKNASLIINDDISKVCKKTFELMTK